MDRFPWHDQHSKRPRVSFCGANCTDIEKPKTFDSLDARKTQDRPRFGWSRGDFYPSMGSSIRAASLVHSITRSNSVSIRHSQLQLSIWTVPPILGSCYQDYESSMTRLLVKVVLDYAVLIVVHRIHVLVMNLKYLRLFRNGCENCRPCERPVLVPASLAPALVQSLVYFSRERSWSRASSTF